MGTFSTDANAAYFVESPDPDRPGQTLRPEAGETIYVRSYPAGDDLANSLTLEYGYISITTASDIDAIVVSLDNWATQVGPWYSSEYLAKIDQRSTIAAMQAVNDTQATTIATLDTTVAAASQAVTNLQTSDLEQDNQIADLYNRVAAAGSGEAGAGLMVWNAVSAAYEPAMTTSKIYIGPSSPTPVPLDNQGLWVKTSA